MAKPKKKSPKPSKSAAKPAKAAKPSASAKPSEAQRILASLPPITDVQRAAFSSQHDDATCDKLGTRTQSAAVSKDAVAFAHTIEGALKKHGPSLRRYSPARFAFFLECIVDLDRTRDEQASGKNDAAPVRRSLDVARARATSARRELHHALDMLVGDHEVDRAELESAVGSAKNDDALVSSLSDLARLADAWLRRPDGESKALVASVDLQRADVDQAWSIANELEHASDRAVGKRVLRRHRHAERQPRRGPRPPRDALRDARLLPRRRRQQAGAPPQPRARHAQRPGNASQGEVQGRQRRSRARPELRLQRPEGRLLRREGRLLRREGRLLRREGRLLCREGRLLAR